MPFLRGVSKIFPRHVPFLLVFLHSDWELFISNFLFNNLDHEDHLKYRLPRQKYREVDKEYNQSYRDHRKADTDTKIRSSNLKKNVRINTAFNKNYPEYKSKNFHEF